MFLWLMDYISTYYERVCTLVTNLKQIPNATFMLLTSKVHNICPLTTPKLLKIVRYICTWLEREFHKLDNEYFNISLSAFPKELLKILQICLCIHVEVILYILYFKHITN
jgi:hypothetical protein